MANGTTPSVGLILGPDASENANWEKIDSLIGLLSGPGVILPGDTQVQGDLQVDGNTTLTGTLTNGNATITNLNSLNIDTTQLVCSDLELMSSGTLALPDGILTQPMLAKGASLQGVWIGGAITSGFNLGLSPIAGASVTLDPTEQIGRWELVVASISMLVNFGPAITGTIAPTWTLNRGGTIMQTRAFSYTATGAALVGTTITVPITLARFQQITDVTPANQVWSVWGNIAATLTGASVSHLFSQVMAVQFT